MVIIMYICHPVSYDQKMTIPPAAGIPAKAGIAFAFSYFINLLLIFSIAAVVNFLYVHAQNESTVNSGTSTFLHLLAHHKAGVVLTRSIVKSICEGKRKSVRVDEACDGVEVSTEGLEQHHAKILSSASHFFIHGIRHPLDMLLSSYLYHKNCKNEPGWLNTPIGQGGFMMVKLIPRDFPLRSSTSNVRNITYCSWLRTHSEEEGIRMELLRSLHAHGGMGKMLHDMKVLRNRVETPSRNIFTLCMTTASSSLHSLQEFVQPWRADGTSKPLVIHDTPEHHTNKSEQASLVQLAFSIIASELPVSLLATFPCPSQFYHAMATTSQFVEGLEVDRSIL